MPDNDALPTGSKRSRFARGAQVSSTTRQLVLGLDDTERKFAFGGAGVALVLALLFIHFNLFHDIISNYLLIISSILNL